MRKAALLVGIFAALPALAAIDYTCLNRCTSRGYMYQFCEEQCSYNLPPPTLPAPINRPPTDYGFIAKGLPPVDIAGAIANAQALKLQRQQMEMQQAQLDAQRQYERDQQARANERTTQNSGSPWTAIAAALEAEQRKQASAAQAESDQFRQVYFRWLNAVAPRRDNYPDFDAVVFADDLRVTDSMIELMAGSPFAADIAYYLGKNKPESLRIAGMPLLDQAVAIKKIEASVSRQP